MAEHNFNYKYQSILTQLRVLAQIINPGVQMGRFQRNDVTAAPRAHTPDVTFSKFKFQSACYEW